MGTFYRSRHELIFTFKHGTTAHINSFELGQNGRYRTNVWEYRGVNSMRAGRIEVDSKELARLKSHVRLYPGMPVEAFIETGSRSFLGYLFAPITGSFERAFKED